MKVIGDVYALIDDQVKEFEYICKWIVFGCTSFGTAIILILYNNLRT